MNRRSFFKVFPALGAAIAAPSFVLNAPSPAVQAIGQMVEKVFYRPDLNQWGVYWTARIMDVDYEYAMLLVEKPTEAHLERHREIALMAFKRAERKASELA